MKRILFCVLTLLSILGTQLLAQNITGSWQATLGDPPNGLRAILKISKSGSDLSAQLFSIDQGPEGIPVSTISLEGSDLKFSIDTIRGSFVGKISADGTSINGTWNQGQPMPLNFVRPTKETEWATDSSRHTVTFIQVEKDVKLEVLDWGGTGRPLILLAGLGNTAHIFDHFAPKLISLFHVYGITRRGYGESSSPIPANDNYSADRLGDDVLAVMAALKVNRPILGGHSIAGEELSSIGSRHPEKVAGLIYLDAGYSYAFYDRSQGDLMVDSADLRRKLSKLFSGVGPHEESAMTEELLKTVLPQLEKDLREHKEELSKVPEATAAQNAEVVSPAAQAIRLGEQKYTELKVPVLAIFAVPHDLGPESEESPAARAAAEASDLIRTTSQLKAFEQGVPTARVVRLPHANHFIFISNEADVLREIVSFASNLPKE